MEKQTLDIKNTASNVALSKKAEKLVVDLVKSSHSVYRKEINHWQQARMAKNSLQHPRHYLLQRVYRDAMLDTHLTAVIENRILRIQNKRFVITDQNGVTIPEKTQLITKKWFSDLVRYALESVHFEYSLIQFIKEGNEIVAVKNIDREHVNPDACTVVKNVSDDSGLDITAFPNDLALVKLYEGGGLLEKAVPLTILKRHSWASWDEFEQIFGMPIRIAKIGSMSDSVKNEVASWLESMGTASYGVFPNFAEIDIKEANNRDAFNVFMKKIETVDAQLSVLINGQTMTVQDGSSHSQASVHQKTQDEISEADLKGFLYWANDVLAPILRNLGYAIAENESIGVERVTDPIEKMKTDEKIMTHSGYRLSKDYLERVYGVELEELPEPHKPNPTQKDQDEKKN